MEGAKIMGLISIISPEGGGNCSTNYMSTSHFVDFWSIFKTFWENYNNFLKNFYSGSNFTSNYVK